MYDVNAQMLDIFEKGLKVAEVPYNKYQVDKTCMLTIRLPPHYEMRLYFLTGTAKYRLLTVSDWMAIEEGYVTQEHIDAFVNALSNRFDKSKEPVPEQKAPSTKPKQTTQSSSQSSSILLGMLVYGLAAIGISHLLSMLLSIFN